MTNHAHNRFAVGITLEVEADTQQVAISVARDAGKSLQGRSGVQHAWLSLNAEPLFDGRAFEQLPGQTGWYLTRCHCCRQDFYTDPSDRENYCPACMRLGR